MQCAACRHENPPRAKFCVECSAALESGCPDCGTLLPAAARFCPGCARPLAAAGLRRAPPGEYTPPHLAEKIRAGRLSLEGERKRVTVLFADIAGSMNLILDRDPEDARVVLDGVIERMMDAVHGSEGTVNQILGDGIMALFGAPVAHEDHAVRACHAALRMQELIGEFANEMRPAIGIELRIRVGINSGDVVVRSIASDLHMDYTAVGQTTHLAARMEQMAGPGEILATREVMRLVEGYVQARPLGLQAVKGLAQPVELFAVAGAAPARTRFEVAVRRGLGRFVGREAELALLENACDSAREGRGRLVGVVGEPGVGKSRLLWEYTRSAQEHGCVVLQGTATARGRNTSYLPLIELLGRHFAIEETDAPDVVAAKLARSLMATNADVAPLQAPLLALFNRPVTDPRWDALDPPQRHLRIVEAVKSVLLRQSQAEPTIVLVADLQWVDAETQSVLDGLVKSLDGSRLLVLAEYRPEYRHGWSALACWSQVQLAPLADETALALFRSLVSGGGELAPLEKMVLARTAGNPFFLEECVRSLVETGLLEGEPGHLRMVRSPETVEIPATVHDVLAARIDRLAAREKALLQVAAVIGTEVPRDILEHAAGLDSREVAAALAQLENADMLSVTAPPPAARHAFKHAFTHEVALASLLQQQRKALHALIMHAIESLQGARLDEHADALAHHALHGEQWMKAVRYLRRAAARATARSAYRNAVGHLEQALQALARMSGEPDLARIEVDVRLELRTPLLALGLFDRMQTVLREAEAIANVHGDAGSRARTAVHITGHLWLTGENAAAVDSGARTLELASASGDPSLLIPARFYIGASRHALGDYRVSAEFMQANLEVLAGHGSRRFGLAGLPGVLCRGIRVLSDTETGEFARADEYAAEAHRIAEVSGHPFSLITAHYVTAVTLLGRGEHGGAIPAIRRGLALSRSEQTPMWYLPLLSRFSLALAQTGQAAEAVQHAERVLSLRRDPINVAAFAASAAGEVMLRAGRIDDAAKQGEFGLALSRRKRERSAEAWFLRLLAEIAASREPRDLRVGEAYYLESLALARALGMRPLEARCRLGLGSLLARNGAREPARAAFAAAASMFEEMGMRSWLQRTQAAEAAAF